MRSIERGTSHQISDFDDYREAFGELSSRLGMYCSYCERRIATQLAVEHIQPKALPAYLHLKGRWENFLLGCVNCNSTKGQKDVILSDVLLPDRDSTSAAYQYTADGRIEVEGALSDLQREMALATLELTGLDKPLSAVLDSAGELVAIDRVAQRMETWGTAQESRQILALSPTDDIRRLIVKLALASGFFSIWMQVFANDIGVRTMLIAQFPGTANDCFDAHSTLPIKPRPANGLVNGGKV